MKILHLFSNYKWTGPAEPALNLARAERELGAEVAFACGSDPDGRRSAIAEQAEERGVPVREDFILSKHLRLFSNVRDALRLKSWLKEERFDLIHCHQQNDHLLAGYTRRYSALRPPIVRTLYDGAVPPDSWRTRLLFRKFSDHVFCISSAVREELRAREGLPAARLSPIETAVDLARFNPEPRGPGLREELGIPTDAFVVVLVSRMQRHRRFEIAIEAFREACAADDRVYGLFVGRGTHRAQVVDEPIRAAGLQKRLLAPGYLAGERFVAAIQAADCKLFLVPGSDGSCRALREAQACGLPAISTRRGALPEINVEGETGLHVDETVASLRDAILRLCRDDELRARLGAGALQRARERYDIQTVARGVLAECQRLLPS